MNIDKITCNLLDGEAVTDEERNAVVSYVQTRLKAGEQGDDVPILMHALGCNYEAACQAVFTGNQEAALHLLSVAGSKAQLYRKLDSAHTESGEEGLNGFLKSFREWLDGALADPYHQFHKEAKEYRLLEHPVLAEEEEASAPPRC